MSTQQSVDPSYATTWTSMAQCIHAMIRFTDKRHFTLVDVMGLTTYAFRIAIDETAGVISPLWHEWEPLCIRALDNLGLKANCFDPLVFPTPPEHIKRALQQIQASLDRGVPTIAWDLFGAQFGLIYGYDDDRQVLFAKDREHDAELPYPKLGEERGKIFTLTIDSSFVLAYEASLRNALGMILAHAAHSVETVANGLTAYDAWIGAFNTGAIDPLGNAYNALVVYDARRFAVRFLGALRDRYQTGELREPRHHDGIGMNATFLQDTAERAAEHYARVEAALAELHQRFPFPAGGDPKDAASRDYAVQCLKRAKSEEAQGVRCLAQMYYAL